MSQMRMSRKIKYTILFTALASFLAVVSGAVMLVHLSCCGDHEEHDSEHCNFCQQLLVINKNSMVEENIRIIDYVQSYDTVRYYFHIIDSISSFIPAIPRGPPS